MPNRVRIATSCCQINCGGQANISINIPHTKPPRINHDAREWERMGEWVKRIGWRRFFELTDLPFTRFHVDNWVGARHTFNHSTHIRF